MGRQTYNSTRHIILIQSQMSLLLILIAACLMEEQQIPFLQVFGLTRRVLEPTIYYTQGEHAYDYTTNGIVMDNIMSPGTTINNLLLIRRCCHLYFTFSEHGMTHSFTCFPKVELSIVIVLHYK